MSEIVDPVIDRLVENTDLVNQTKTDQEKCADTIEDLRNTVFQSNGKLDVFEQINLKIANLEAERKILEDKVDYENKTSKARMDEIDSRNEMTQKIFKNMQKHTEDVMKELTELKETYK